MADWRSDPLWTGLKPNQRLALMGLMEAGPSRYDAALNTVHANVNRSQKLGWDTDRVLNYRQAGSGYGWFQPLYEPAQRARAQAYLKLPQFATLSEDAQRRIDGGAEDRVAGATHYLVPEKTMVSLEARQPNKYKNWGPSGQNWTGYDPSTGSYKGVTHRDNVHAFLVPGGEGRMPPPMALGGPRDSSPAAADAAAAGREAEYPKEQTMQTVRQSPVQPASNGVDLGQMAELNVKAQRSKILAEMLNGMAYNKDAVRHPLEGISRVVAAVGGGYAANKQDEATLTRDKAVAGSLGGLSPVAAAMYGSGDPAMRSAVASSALSTDRERAERERLQQAVQGVPGMNTPENQAVTSMGNPAAIQQALSDLRKQSTLQAERERLTRVIEGTWGLLEAMGPAGQAALATGNPDMIKGALAAHFEQKDPEIVRALRAAKLDPTSPAGQKIIQQHYAKAGERNLNYGDIEKMSKEGGTFDELKNIDGTFKPEFGGFKSGIVGDASNIMGRNLGGKFADQAEWWQRYDRHKTAIRHGWFGASLTATERPEWDKLDIHPGMDPKVIAANLRAQRDMMERKVRTKMEALKAAKFDVAPVEAAYGISLGEIKKPAAASAAGAGDPGGSYDAVPTATAPAAASPTVGTMSDGYRYKGGNINDPENWEPVK